VVPAGGTAYPTYEVNGLAKFLKWACDNTTAKDDIVSYGFTRLTTAQLRPSHRGRPHGPAPRVVLPVALMLSFHSVNPISS
jgi:hypothetical protein